VTRSQSCNEVIVDKSAVGEKIFKIKEGALYSRKVFLLINKINSNKEKITRMQNEIKGIVSKETKKEYYDTSYLYRPLSRFR
jgi:hypothetical protein